MNSPNPTGDMADEVKLLTWTRDPGEAVAWRLVISGDISPFFLLLLLVVCCCQNDGELSVIIISAKADEVVRERKTFNFCDRGKERKKKNE
ncbi:hypothetical protein CEXT_47411 [Caerostris extrusa]|uniref:Uncharacterized protein n=1 Tax=Caerostris extrusa TaxID=172846 RepID=A0AAV4VJK2_CAEEX|nr:hypothetical protein CEXT_47411 [Caerostris extrusa]